MAVQAIQIENYNINIQSEPTNHVINTEKVALQCKNGAKPKPLVFCFAPLDAGKGT